MGFFHRNRKALAARGIDPARLPPGQYHTDRFPVLHVGDVPTIDLATWTLGVDGLVGRPTRWTFDELRALPTVAVRTDIHCVTKWSKFDTDWEGVRIRDLIAAAGGADPLATHVVQHAEHGYTANLPLADVTGDDAVVAWSFGGEPLEPKHGWPVRTVVPHLYFWKSVKWVRRIELVGADQPGFWERNGYHDYGDPWREQRHWGDS